MTETKTPVTVSVGDVFVESWGYDQTNIDFYQVVGITPSGKSVRLRHVGQSTVETEGGHFTYEHVVPVIDGFHEPRGEWDTGIRNGAVFTKRIKPGSDWINFTSYSGGRLWDGSPKYQTNSQFGH